MSEIFSLYSKQTGEFLGTGIAQIDDEQTGFTDVLYPSDDPRSHRWSVAAQAWVPMSISPMQARIVLMRHGLLDAVEQFVHEESSPPILKVAWEYATEIRRDSRLVNDLAVRLGLTQEQLDQMFIEAAEIVL